MDRTHHSLRHTQGDAKLKYLQRSYIYMTFSLHMYLNWYQFLMKKTQETNLFSSFPVRCRWTKCLPPCCPLVDILWSQCRVSIWLFVFHGSPPSSSPSLSTSPTPAPMNLPPSSASPSSLPASSSPSSQSSVSSSCVSSLDSLQLFFISERHHTWALALNYWLCQRVIYSRSTRN